MVSDGASLHRPRRFGRTEVNVRSDAAVDHRCARVTDAWQTATLPVLRDEPADGLECGPCGACCVLPALESLGKPMYRACDHLRRDGCDIYSARPLECRRFHCLWLQGAFGPDPALRPDRLGVMFDGYHPSHDPSSSRWTALELWPGAFDDPRVRSAVAAWGPIDVIRRDGCRETVPAAACDIGADGLPRTRDADALPG
jgi:hypothetical protein